MQASPGRPLDPEAGAFAATHFRHDFSRVRIHTDARAARLSRGLEADAFTVGADIYFGAGRYAPGGATGRFLLAHELAHTVQNQQTGLLATRPRALSRPGDAAEQEAEHAAHQAISTDAPVPVHHAPQATIQRQPTGARQNRQEIARAAYLKELAKWPNRAHQAWKRLESQERFAVMAQMGLYYGDAFARQFAKAAESGATLTAIHYGPGFPEQTHAYFQERGYQLAQTGAGVDSVVEWWVHPTGKTIMKIRERNARAKAPQSQNPPQEQTPPPDDPKELLDLSLDILRGSIAEGKKRQADLEKQKAQLGKKNKTTPEYKKDFERYMRSLKDMGRFVDGQLDSINELRQALEGAKGDVAQLDLASQELSDLGIWVDVESSDPMLFGLKPLDVDIKDFDEEDADEDE